MHSGHHVARCHQGRFYTVTDIRLEKNESIRSLRENSDGSLTVVMSGGVLLLSTKGVLKKLSAPRGAPSVPWGAVLPGDRSEIRYRAAQLALDRLRRVFDRDQDATGWTARG